MVNLQWDTYMWIDTVQRGLGCFKLTEVSFAQTQQTVVLSEITGQLVKYFNTDLLLLLEKDELMLQSYSQILRPGVLVGMLQWVTVHHEILKPSD